jgi:hypothetical protein
MHKPDFGCPFAVCAPFALWDGRQCVCPSGKYWTGQACCPFSSTWAASTSTCVCNPGHTWDGSACACSTGLIWNGQACCPPYALWDGRQCFCPAPKYYTGVGCCVVDSVWMGPATTGNCEYVALVRLRNTCHLPKYALEDHWHIICDFH